MPEHGAKLMRGTKTIVCSAECMDCEYAREQAVSTPKDRAYFINMVKNHAYRQGHELTMNTAITYKPNG